jgi:hypothetical protein
MEICSSGKWNVTVFIPNLNVEYNPQCHYPAPTSSKLSVSMHFLSSQPSDHIYLHNLHDPSFGWEISQKLNARLIWNLDQILTNGIISQKMLSKLPYILEFNLHLVFARKKVSTPAVSFFQNPALDRESNPHPILICIWFLALRNFKTGED